MLAFFAFTNIGLSGYYTHPHHVCDVVLSILFRTEHVGGLSDVPHFRDSFQDELMHVVHLHDLLGPENNIVFQDHLGRS